MSLSIDVEEVSIVIKDFIKTYVDNSGYKRVALGFSGGVDSAVVAILCKESLGRENVLCIFLPDETTPEDDRKHQEYFVKKFNLKSRQTDITPIVNQIRSIDVEKPKAITLANIKARVRMILLYKYANDADSLICGAANKSELLIGYFTKYGDGGVDFQPIGDLYKTQVYQLAKFLKIPKMLLSKPPTAGLWAGQTDEKELEMGYEKLDKILYGLEHNFDVIDISKAANATKSDVERIRQMSIKSQHKRSTPLIPKIGIRTPGIDWRVPVQEG
ncbi:MAG: NAD+ synthase [Thermoplasmatales archaeon]|nr:MAG: NAD+ synthase [Thermoplasmatales archaeon]